MTQEQTMEPESDKKSGVLEKIVSTAKRANTAVDMFLMDKIPTLDHGPAYRQTFCNAIKITALIGAATAGTLAYKLSGSPEYIASHGNSENARIIITAISTLVGAGLGSALGLSFGVSKGLQEEQSEKPDYSRLVHAVGMKIVDQVLNDAPLDLEYALEGTDLDTAERGIMTEFVQGFYERATADRENQERYTLMATETLRAAKDKLAANAQLARMRPEPSFDIEAYCRRTSDRLEALPKHNLEYCADGNREPGAISTSSAPT
ncbi:MAG: hypothetical protein ABIE94_04480 [archaeon]